MCSLVGNEMCAFEVCRAGQTFYTPKTTFEDFIKKSGFAQLTDWLLCRLLRTRAERTCKPQSESVVTLLDLVRMHPKHSGIDQMIPDASGTSPEGPE